MKMEIIRLRKLLSEQEKEIVALRLIADYDFLTGLYNRQGFVREAEKFLNSLKTAHRIRRKHGVFNNISFIFIDLDDLKTVNDLYGHKYGDQMIKMSAEVFKSNLRDLDVIGRWGGDEFIIALIDAEEEDAVKIARKIQSKLSEIRIKSIKQKITASFGIISVKSKYRKDIYNLYELIEKADMAMYVAKKENKKNCVTSFNQ